MTVTLITDYGFVNMQNPTEIWVSRRFLPPLYGLQFSDDKYEYKTIYTSDNKSLLFRLKDKIIDEIANGKTRIDLR